MNRGFDSQDGHVTPHASLFVFLTCLVAGGMCHGESTPASQGNIAVRAENFTVPPSTGPLAHILIRNTGDVACEATVRPTFPRGWQWTPAQRVVTVEPRQVARVPFTIEKATDVELNQYPVEIVVLEGAKTTLHRQNVVCASAPYFRPKIDGKFKDWSDAIPITFTTAGKETTVNTYWNKQFFYLYVQVEESRLCPYKKNAAMVDAVQVCVAPRRAVTAAAAMAKSQRYEFLAVASTGLFAKDKCFFLTEAGTELSVAQEPRALAKIPELEEAKVVVKRHGDTTHYECAIPFAAMPKIRPDIGREICVSVLIHDPDGTGVRDWGEETGLWPEQRNPLAWCAWGSLAWAENPPYDGKIEWGLCSSKQ